MEPTGIIFAGLDCDADSIEAWNRWYDLEHVPPNVSMAGVMLGRRYVAPPELHDLRRVLSSFYAGRCRDNRHRAKTDVFRRYEASSLTTQSPPGDLFKDIGFGARRRPSHTPQEGHPNRVGEHPCENLKR